MKSDVTKFCFCEMFQIIMDDKDSKYIASAKIDDCKIKFYNSQGDVHVVILDENGYNILECGNFYDMYCTSDNLVFPDLIRAKFDIIDIRKNTDKKKDEQWILCDFNKACSAYDSGGSVRLEKPEGVVEYFSRTRCEGKHAWAVIDYRLEGWEYKI